MSLHTKIEAYILEQIQNGTLKPGDQIPTETELSVMFSASRPTVRQALSKLTLQNYLVRTKGKGSFVARNKVLHESTSFLSGYRQESEKKGQELTTKVLGLSLMNGSRTVTKKLSLPDRSKVIRLTRVRFVSHFNDGKPVVYTTAYVPYQRFPEMLSLDFNAISFYEALKEKELPVRHASRRLEVVMPDPVISEALQITCFEPAVFISSVGYTADETIIEYTESYYPASCSQFLIEVNH